MSTYPWHDQARELLATGLRVQQVADLIGKSDDAVRVALNINGAADRYRARLERMKARKKQVIEAVPQSCGPRVMTITLPFISLPAPACEETRPLRFAPATRLTSSPGAERWRSIHLAMLRRGLVPQRDLVAEWRH